MIPYVEIPAFVLWGHIFQPFGTLFVTGCLVGFFVARWQVKTRGLSVDEFELLALWGLFWALALSHIVALAVYHPEDIVNNPWRLLDLRRGGSSFGGFFGGLIAAVVYLRYKKLPVIEYVEAVVFGVVAGWFFLRLGCSIAHDHPGRHTDFFLAIRYPDGPRHDLGFYEWLLTIATLAVIFVMRRRNPPRRGDYGNGVPNLCACAVRFGFPQGC